MLRPDRHLCPTHASRNSSLEGRRPFATTYPVQSRRLDQHRPISDPSASRGLHQAQRIELECRRRGRGPLAFGGAGSRWDRAPIAEGPVPPISTTISAIRRLGWSPYVTFPRAESARRKVHLFTRQTPTACLHAAHCRRADSVHPDLAVRRTRARAVVVSFARRVFR